MVLQGLHLSVPEFVAKHGRNCHMPNALQTPLHAAVSHYVSVRGASDEEKREIYQR
jgi:hypothetical protein